jgi:very-short-patch-repair endonuclease
MWLTCQNFHRGRHTEGPRPQTHDVNPLVRSQLRGQAGVISRAQALAAGLSARQIDYLLQRGEWLHRHPGVYQLSAVVPTPESSLRAAALWLGSAGVLTGLGAAWWWEMSSDPPSIWHFVTRDGAHRQSRPDVRLSRSFVDPFDQTTRQQVPVLTRPLAVLRAAAYLEKVNPGRGIALIDRAKQRRWVGLADLEQAFTRNKGTWGTRTMRRLLDRTGDRAHSELERIAVSLLRSAGITGFVVNHRITLSSGRPVEFDIAFTNCKVAVELDGYAYHAGPEEHRADVRRANEIMADGWTVRRFTYSDLLNDPEGFIATVRQVLSR